MADLCLMLASFTAPIEMGTDKLSMLWMFPLLAAIALVYKATKMRVLMTRKYATCSRSITCCKATGTCKD